MGHSLLEVKIYLALGSIHKQTTKKVSRVLYQRRRQPLRLHDNQPPQDESRATLYISVLLQSYFRSILFSKWFVFLDHTGVLVLVPGTCYYLAIAKTLETPLKQKISEKNKFLAILHTQDARNAPFTTSQDDTRTCITDATTTPSTVVILYSYVKGR